jgi:Family of unknown function (DUF6464)
MRSDTIRELIKTYKEWNLKDLNESLLYWQQSINRWLERHNNGLEYSLPKPFISHCKQRAIDNTIVANILIREIELREKGFAIMMEPKRLQKIGEDFINSIIETCLYGGGEVHIECQDSRKILVIKLAEVCKYRSDSPLLKCAVNPSGDCQSCQFKEVE